MILDILALVWVHFVADFMLQTDRMAINKSKSMKWLLLHVSVYSAPFLIFGPIFAAVNFALHLATDFISSKVASVLWGKGERHWFFVVIGADQAVHMTCLLVTYHYLVV